MGIFGNRIKKELEELQATTAKWERMLGPKYRDAWKIWLSNCKIVARKFDLNEIEVARLTCRESARYAIFSLKNCIGLTDDNLNQIVATRGNTNIIMLIGEATDDFNLYTEKCNKFIPIKKFDEEINSVSKRIR